MHLKFCRRVFERPLGGSFSHFAFCSATFRTFASSVLLVSCTSYFTALPVNPWFVSVSILFCSVLFQGGCLVVYTWQAR